MKPYHVFCALNQDKLRHVGVIAQEVQAQFPEIVEEIFDGRFLGVRYIELIPVLIEAIQELNTEVKACHTFMNHELISEDMNKSIEKIRKSNAELKTADISHGKARNLMQNKSNDIKIKHESLQLMNFKLHQRLSSLEKKLLSFTQ